MDIKQLMADVEHGDGSAAFEAAKTLSNLPDLPAREVMEAFQRAENLHNREAIAYTLSWLRRKEKHEILQALMKIANDIGEDPAVRGQALEGLGVQKAGRRHRLWR